MIKKSDQSKVLQDLGLSQEDAEQVITCSAVAADLRHEARVATIRAGMRNLGPLAGVLLLRMEEAARKGRLGATPPTFAWVGGGSGRRHASDSGAWRAAITDAAFRAERKLGETPAESPSDAGETIGRWFTRSGDAPVVRWALEAAVVVALDNRHLYTSVQQAAAFAAAYLRADAWISSASAVCRYSCPICWASAGDPCRAPNGYPKPLAHLGRVALLGSATGEEPVDANETATGEEPVDADETATEEVAAKAGE